MRKSKRMTKKQIREKRKIAREIKNILIDIAFLDMQMRQSRSIREFMKLKEKRSKLAETLETFKK